MSQEASKEAAADISTRLAHERTDAATTRTRMAADRTPMGWIRTAVFVRSYEFTISNFWETMEGHLNIPPPTGAVVAITPLLKEPCAFLL